MQVSITMPIHQYVFPARSVRVVDGDTLILEISVGFYLTTTHSVRLLRVNAPEMKTPTYAEGHAAKAYVEAWLAEGAIGDWPYVVETHKSDVFGRYLAEVWRLSDGTNLSDALLDSGNAVAYP